MKTIKDLNTKHWYRVLKVLYVLVILSAIAIVYNNYYPSIDNFSTVIEPLIWTLLVLEGFKRAIYYVYFGTIFPQKAEMSEYISKIRSTMDDFKKEMGTLPESTQSFLEYVMQVGQMRVDEFEKKDGKRNNEDILKVYKLVIASRNLYDTNIPNFDALTSVKARVLCYALDLGMDVDSFKINL